MPRRRCRGRAPAKVRQLRRWLTQLLVTERVVAAEAAAVGVTVEGAPAEDELLPDNVGAAGDRQRRGGGAGRRRWPGRCSCTSPRRSTSPMTTWRTTTPVTRSRFAEPSERRKRLAQPRHSMPRRLDAVRPLIAEHLRGAARRRAFRLWLDARCADLVGSRPATSIPAIPASPTTPTDTDGRPDARHRHRRHEDRRRARRRRRRPWCTTRSCPRPTATPRRYGRWSTRWSPRRSPPLVDTCRGSASPRRARSTCRPAPSARSISLQWQRFPIVERVHRAGRRAGAAGRRRPVHGAR